MTEEARGKACKALDNRKKKDDCDAHDMFSALRELGVYGGDASCNTIYTKARSIPPSMFVSPKLFPKDIGKSKLASLHVSATSLIIQGEKIADEVIRENTGKYGSVCFVVRRPGCGLCREEGLSLNKITARMDKPLEGFGLFGIVKETGVDDSGLATFQSFFPYPLYRDERKAFYKALGNRKMKQQSVVWSAACAAKVSKRLKKKRIESNTKGESMVQGGLIFFGVDGKPRYIYREETGKEIPEQDVLAVIDSMRTESQTAD